MAYRRRQGITRVSTFKEDYIQNNDDLIPSSSSSTSDNYSSSSVSSPSSSSLAAQAIRASAAHRDSSHSSAYGNSAFNNSFKERNSISKGSTYDYTSMRSTNEPGGFWGVLARKAKAILEDDEVPQQFESSSPRKPLTVNTSSNSQYYHSNQSPEGARKMDNPRLRKGLDALTSSLNHIGDTIGNALEEGRTIVENKTADIIQETRRIQTRRKGMNGGETFGFDNQWPEPRLQSAKPQMQPNQENQLKASRDVAIATAAKAKLLLRELKTVKADLTFAKQRCSQLEEENKLLRESREKGVNPADDDMIRLQLETLLAEKARLAHENSVYARENRFLREIVEYHQLTMQDVVYLDEGIEEVTEVHPGVTRMLSVSPTSPSSPRSPPELSPSTTPLRTFTRESSPAPKVDAPKTDALKAKLAPADVPKAKANAPPSLGSPASPLDTST